tara:strand:+ start:202 stop:351 length:150 start_codon:yes stop_codon:yes gene_type:complete
MDVWLIVLMLFFSSGLERVVVEPEPVLQGQQIASNGSVGICSQAPCIWK